MRGRESIFPSRFRKSHLFRKMTTYQTILFRFNGPNKVLARGLTLEQAQEVCRDPNTSSKTCEKASYFKRWGDGPWFVGYDED
jgi:hypothetical protein